MQSTQTGSLASSLYSRGSGGKNRGKLLKYKNWNKPNKKTEIQLMWSCFPLLIITWGVWLYLVIN